MRYVDEVVPSPWLIDEEFLDLHNIDLLVHGSDNSNPISSERLLTLNRTQGLVVQFCVVECCKRQPNSFFKELV